MGSDREEGRAGDGGGWHPADDLPEYVRGALASGVEARVEAHLRGCARCRAEADALAALAAPDRGLDPVERERVWRGLAGALAAGEASSSSASGAGSAGGRPRASALWRLAAAAAVLVAALGVWQVNRHAASGGPWEPAEAVLAWERDLEALRPDAEEVRVALGFGSGEPFGGWLEISESGPDPEPVGR